VSIYDKDGNLQKGGKSVYQNEKNEIIIVESIDTSKLKISVDKDNDGGTDSQEIISL